MKIIAIGEISLSPSHLSADYKETHTMPRHDYIPLKHVLPKGMTAKVARSHLRSQNKFRQHDGRWEFPKKTADRVEGFLVDTTD